MLFFSIEISSNRQFHPGSEWIARTHDIILYISFFFFYWKKLEEGGNPFSFAFIREQLNHLANLNGLNTVERSLHGWFLAPFLNRRRIFPRGEQSLLPIQSSLSITVRRSFHLPFDFLFSLARNHPFRRGLINRSVVYSPSDHDRYDPFLGSKGKIPILFYGPLTRPICGMAKVDEFS